MKKIILWSTISLLVVGAAVWAFLWLRRPQTMMLSDGTKLTLLGVEYGKHHKFPTVKVNGARRAVSESFDTPEDTLIVWLLQEHKGNNWPNYQALVYDRAETGCSANWSRNNHQLRQGTDIVAIQLDAFPRRDRKFYLRFQTWGPSGQKINKEQFVVSNPVRGPFPTWVPTALPATESDGDLDVTLTRFVFGVGGFNGGNGSTKDPANKAVLAAFTMVQNGSPATNWVPVLIKTSDATGNQSQNQSWSNQQGDNGEQTMNYQWGLWPNEPAWKVRVEMSRTSGFADDEIWTVTDIPVRPGTQQEMWGYGRQRTNAFFAETTLNGVGLKIFPAIRFTDMNSGVDQKMGGFRIMTDTDPTTNGFRLTALKVTDDTGRMLQSWNGGSGGGNFSFRLPNIRNTKTLNVTLALHKSRFVEFTAKPVKP